MQNSFTNWVAEFFLADLPVACERLMLRAGRLCLPQFGGEEHTYMHACVPTYLPNYLPSQPPTYLLNYLPSHPTHPTTDLPTVTYPPSDRSHMQTYTKASKTSTSLVPAMASTSPPVVIVTGWSGAGTNPIGFRFAWFRFWNLGLRFDGLRLSVLGIGPVGALENILQTYSGHMLN